MGVQWGGVVFRWVLAEKQTQSQEDAEELMAKNGGALKKLSLTPNTVSVTCTEAETVQESLWKHHRHRHLHLHFYRLLLQLLLPLLTVVT